MTRVIPEQARLAHVRGGYAAVEIGGEVVGSVRRLSNKPSSLKDAPWVPYRPYGAPLREAGTPVQCDTRGDAVAYLVNRHLRETSDAD